MRDYDSNELDKQLGIVGSDEDPFKETKTLIDTVTESRDLRSKEIERKNLIKVDFWVTTEGFVSPYPDRTTIIHVADIISLMEAMLKIKKLDEQTPNTVISAPEGLLSDIQSLMTSLDLKPGYLVNPEKEYMSWVAFTANMPHMTADAIPDILEPIQMPSDISETSQESFEAEESYEG
jgi:hypothetical protein